jgi:hypothetical protein
MTIDGTNELERLRKVYGDLGDGELLRIAEDPESFTEAGQTALAQELERRGLKAPAPVAETLDDGSAVLPQVQEATAADERADAFGVGVPGMVPAAGAAVEQALEPGGETKLGMTALVSFFDGMQLSQACEALEDAGVSPAVQEIEGDATTGTPSRFEIWVDQDEVERGKAALRVRLGLFPLAEVDEAPDAELLAEATDGIVGQFDTRAEAEEAQLTLVNAGFPAEVLKADESSQDDDATFLLKVPPHDYARAFTVLAEKLSAPEE